MFLTNYNGTLKKELENLQNLCPNYMIQMQTLTVRRQLKHREKKAMVKILVG